jgi:hypothetical protein
VTGASLLELAFRLEAHIRLEERELFPLLERLAPEEELRRALRVTSAPARSTTADP